MIGMPGPGIEINRSRNMGFSKRRMEHEGSMKDNMMLKVTPWPPF